MARPNGYWRLAAGAGSSKVTYDEVTDTLYVYFSQQPVARSEELTDRLIVDYDASGSVRGIELLDAGSPRLKALGDG